MFLTGPICAPQSSSRVLWASIHAVQVNCMLLSKGLQQIHCFFSYKILVIFYKAVYVISAAITAVKKKTL